MKHAFIFLMTMAAIICNRLNAQLIYPLTGIGIEPQMKLTGKWGLAANFADGKMKADEYASVDLSPSLSRSEKKKYGKSPQPEFHLYYEGEMKNNTFNGLGKLRFTNRNTGHLDWTYTGDFEDGKANGFGELSCYFLTSKPGTITECWFRFYLNMDKSPGMVMVHYCARKWIIPIPNSPPAQACQAHYI